MVMVTIFLTPTLMIKIKKRGLCPLFCYGTPVWTRTRNNCLEGSGYIPLPTGAILLIQI